MPKSRVVSHGLQELASKLERVGSEPEMRQLLCQLPEAMASEVAAAPVGTRPYALGPGERRPMRSGEAAWLRALWSQYGADQSTPFLRAFCSQLLGLQVTLGDKDQPDLRNQIDLVGVSVNDRLPVVIQFETEDAGQSAIAALLGAAARALAIKKAWPHRLRGDWLEALRAAGLGEPRLPVFLERMSIVVAAPPTFWAAARHADASRSRKRNAPSLGRCLGELESALSYLGFWVLLVRLEVLQSRRGLPFRIRPWLESVPAA